MAEDEGHSIVFTPPYHSDLQPIELVWAITKGDVGRQYDINTTFSDVLVRLKKAFKDLSSDSINGCVRKTDSILNTLYDEIIEAEMLEESSEESDCLSIDL
jgi:transposase